AAFVGGELLGKLSSRSDDPGCAERYGYQPEPADQDRNEHRVLLVEALHSPLPVRRACERFLKPDSSKGRLPARNLARYARVRRGTRASSPARSASTACSMPPADRCSSPSPRQHGAPCSRNASASSR